MKRSYIIRLSFVSVAGIVAACAVTNDEAADSVQQRAEDPNKNVVCLRVDLDPKTGLPTGHPNIDDYNRNKNDKEWLDTWTNSLGNIMSGNAGDCSKPVQDVVTCIGADGKASKITLTRGVQIDASAKPEKTIHKVIKAGGSCRKSYCDDPSGGGFSGGHCKDPHLEGPAFEDMDSIELSAAVTSEVSMNVPGFGGGGIKVEVGQKVGRSSKVSYQCRSELEEGVAACSAVAIQASMDCTVSALKVPLYAKCTTEAISATNGVIRRSSEEGTLIGKATGWELEKGAQTHKKTCIGCSAPGGPAANPDGTPFCAALAGDCLKDNKPDGGLKQDVDETKKKVDDARQKLDDLKKRGDELKKKLGCATPLPDVLTPTPSTTAVFVANYAPRPGGTAAAPSGTATATMACAYDAYFANVDAVGETIVTLGQPLTAAAGAMINGTVLTVDLPDGTIAPFLVHNDLFTNRALVTWVGDQRSQVTTELSANSDGSIRLMFGVPSTNTVGTGTVVDIPADASLDAIIHSLDVVRETRFSEASASLYTLAVWAQQAPNVPPSLRETLARATLETALVRSGPHLLVTRR